MRTTFNNGDKVYVNLYDESLIGVIISDISKTLFNNPSTIYSVRLIKDGKLFVKAISVHNLSMREVQFLEDDYLNSTPKLPSYRKGYSKFHQQPYFYKSYSSIEWCKDRVGRRKVKKDKALEPAPLALTDGT